MGHATIIFNLLLNFVNDKKKSKKTMHTALGLVNILEYGPQWTLNMTSAIIFMKVN